MSPGGPGAGDGTGGAGATGGVTGGAPTSAGLLDADGDNDSGMGGMNDHDSDDAVTSVQSAPAFHGVIGGPRMTPASEAIQKIRRKHFGDSK